MIGSKIGSYEVSALLGQGGMGRVYKAVDTMLQRDVALKVLHPGLTADADLVERFRVEAITLAKLHHPSITELYALIREESKFIMVMEFVAGENLDDHIKRNGAITIERTLAVCAQILDAFEYAHSQGVIHRDIKPANIMLCPGDRIKIMDFGIARVMGATRMTMTGRLVGTPNYMSPEQILGRDVDNRSDIYSLGIVLYQMITGAVPFSRTSDFAILRSQVEDPPPSPREMGQDISGGLENVLMRALKKNPEDRFQSVAQFKAALCATETLSDDSDRVSVRGGGEQTPLNNNSSAEPEPETSRLKYYYLAGALAVVLLALGVWALASGGSSRPRADPVVKSVPPPEPQHSPAGAAGQPPPPVAVPVPVPAQPAVERQKLDQAKKGKPGQERLTEEEKRVQDEARRALTGDMENGSTLQDRLKEQATKK